MAEVVLKNIKKIYPHDAEEEKKKKKKGEGNPEKRNNLQITDEGVVAVQQFSLDIDDKEFIVLVGPSGCGKSTTLRMIAGLEEITEGELYIDGKLMNKVAPKDRDIAMVFQSYALYPHMSVYENMAYSLKVKKYSKADIDKKVREAAAVLDITDLLDRKPKALSGGQKQRVAIGRAFVRDPKVFLMDEPLSNLDAKLRNQMRAEIIKLRKKIDTTFIYVTHDQTEAMTLGDRIVIMKDGFIQQIGTPQQVFTKPKNMFVAGFIGVPQMNFFRECRLVSGDDGYKVSVLGREYSLTAGQSAVLTKAGAGSREVIVGVRPVDVNVTACGSESADAVIEVSEMMGSEMHLHMKGESDIISIVSTSEVDPDEMTAGKYMKIDFAPKAIHLFDAETEESLLYED